MNERGERERGREGGKKVTDAHQDKEWRSTAQHSTASVFTLLLSPSPPSPSGFTEIGLHCNPRLSESLLDRGGWSVGDGGGGFRACGG